MLRSLYSGVSGMQQAQQRIDVIGNNIANVNTTGYKASSVTFEDTMSQTLSSNAAGTMQVGTGVATGAIRTLFTPSSLAQTDAPNDLGVDGEGYFVVQNPATGENFATRDGAFTRTSDGYLVNSSGFRLQGFSDAALTTRGDIKIDTTGAPADAAVGATVSSYTFNQNGTLKVTLTDGKTFDRGQVLLKSFTNPQALVKEGSNLYSSADGASMLTDAQTPQTAGLGKVRSGWLEMSNVDLATEMTSLILAQRGYQANARIIVTSDEVIQEAVNLKR